MHATRKSARYWNVAISLTELSNDLPAIDRAEIRHSSSAGTGCALALAFTRSPGEAYPMEQNRVRSRFHQRSRSRHALLRSVEGS
jgi:hypothetical protein